MAQTFIPSELTYRLDPKPDSSIVQQRIESVLSNSTALHRPDSNNTIRFSINSDQFVDLSSISLYSKLQVALTGSATHGTPGAGVVTTKVAVPSSYELFSSITLSTGSGQVIEQLSDANVIGRMMLNMLAPDRKASIESFTNSQDTPHERESCQTPTDFKIGALSLLGFLGSGKYIRTSDLGGLVIECQLAPNSTLFQVPAGATASLSMTDTRLIFDSCLMSQAYIDSYKASYSSGLALMFSSIQSHQSSIQTTVSQNIAFNSNSSRCKGIVSVLRPTSAVGNIEQDSTAGTSNFTDFWYQYDVGSGHLLPSHPVNSYSRALSEVLKLQKNHSNPQCQIYNRTQFSSDYTHGTTYQQGYGKFVMALDTESFDSSPESGIKLSGACQLRMNGSVTTPQTVSIFVLRDVGLIVDINSKRVSIIE
jgi:hypothetical protein